MPRRLRAAVPPRPSCILGTGPRRGDVWVAGPAPSPVQWASPPVTPVHLDTLEMRSERVLNPGSELLRRLRDRGHLLATTQAAGGVVDSVSRTVTADVGTIEYLSWLGSDAYAHHFSGQGWHLWVSRCDPPPGSDASPLRLKIESARCHAPGLVAEADLVAYRLGCDPPVVTRIDVCRDAVGVTLPPDLWQCVVSYAHVREGFMGTLRESMVESVEVPHFHADSLQLLTLGIGARGSGRYFRVYRKDVELQTEDWPALVALYASWGIAVRPGAPIVRFEGEARSEHLRTLSDPTGRSYVECPGSLFAGFCRRDLGGRRRGDGWLFLTSPWQLGQHQQNRDAWEPYARVADVRWEAPVSTPRLPAPEPRRMVAQALGCASSACASLGGVQESELLTRLRDVADQRVARAAAELREALLAAGGVDLLLAESAASVDRSEARRVGRLYRVPSSVVDLPSIDATLAPR